MLFSSHLRVPSDSAILIALVILYCCYLDWSDAESIGSGQFRMLFSSNLLELSNFLEWGKRRKGGGGGESGRAGGGRD